METRHPGKSRTEQPGSKTLSGARPDSYLSYPKWAIRSHRALGLIEAPPAEDVSPTIMNRIRLLGVFLIARTVIASAGYWVAALNGWWIVAIGMAGLAYGSAVSAIHHLIHGQMGFSRRTQHVWLTVLGCLALESGHALQTTHLLHHEVDSDAPDPEGYIENVTWRQLPVAALRFRYRLGLWGLGHGAHRRLIGAELGFHALVHVVSLALLPVLSELWIYVSIIHLASFVFAVLAGKGPQTSWGRPIASPFVRVHTRLGRLIFSHDQHLEHHIWPTVPLSRLRRLHGGLQPILAKHQVVDVQVPL